MSMLISAAACGITATTGVFLSGPKLSKTAYLSGNPALTHIVNGVTHRSLGTTALEASARRATVRNEGHPRGNGDGPLTRITFSNNGWS